jgi:arylsulfatase A-like enzyme/glycosyltransferase involved in cell wall biosynthesis
MKNIIWIVIDTLRSDMLASCLSDKARYNEIDDILEQGALFTDVMTCGGSTRTSAPAYFSSLRPALTGMTGHSIQVLRDFNDDVLTITEHFKHHGYQTFRWSDTDLDSCQPKRGFDIFEAGYPTIENAPNKSYDNEKRADFIKQVRRSKKPFFAYFHLYFIHDFGGLKRSKWSTEEYLEIISGQAKDFKSLWNQLAPGENDIAVITSDHGCILDRDYRDYDAQMAWGFADSKTRVFASFVGENITPAKNHELIRSIDIAPTLLDLALGKDMKAQGVSLKKTLEGGPVPPLIGIAERNTDYNRQSSITNHACVRKQNWSLYLNNGSPTALYDNTEGEFETNYLGTDLKVENELHDFYKKTVVEGPQTATELYSQNGLSIEEIRGEIEVSILLPVFSWSEKIRLAIDSLLDQILLTELILLDGDESGEVSINISEKYNDRLFLKHVDARGMNVQKMLNLGLEQASGPFTVTATPDCQYTENLCYVLRKYFISIPDTVLSYPNLKRIISDRRRIEYIGNDVCFDEIIFTRLGSSFEHRAGAAAFSLPHFNEIGACAMFETATLRNAGGFAYSSSDVLGKTWHKLSRRGRIIHADKGLAISTNQAVLRPTLPGQNIRHDVKVSILVPLLEPKEIRTMPMFLETISQQTEKSIEILFLCPDDRQNFITTLADNFPDLKIRTLKRPAGGFELLNAGLSAARGEYIFWADISDKLLPDCLATLLEQLQGSAEVTAAKCGYFLHGTGNTAQTVSPVAQVRDMLKKVCDLRGLLYKRSLHNHAGIFKPAAEIEQGWDMCVRLGLVHSFEAVEEPLIIANRTYQFNMHPSVESYHRILHNAINSMGNVLDMVRLYEDVFRQHKADRARYILEEEMMATHKLINTTGVESKSLLRVPKTHLF